MGAAASRREETMRRLFVILVFALTVGFAAASLVVAQDAGDTTDGTGCATPMAGMMATPEASPMAGMMATPTAGMMGTPEACATPAP